MQNQRTESGQSGATGVNVQYNVIMEHLLETAPVLNLPMEVWTARVELEMTL